MSCPFTMRPVFGSWWRVQCGWPWSAGCRSKYWSNQWAQMRLSTDEIIYIWWREIEINAPTLRNCRLKLLDAKTSTRRAIIYQDFDIYASIGVNNALCGSEPESSHRPCTVPRLFLFFNVTRSFCRATYTVQGSKYITNTIILSRNSLPRRSCTTCTQHAMLYLAHALLDVKRRRKPRVFAHDIGICNVIMQGMRSKSFRVHLPRLVLTVSERPMRSHFRLFPWFDGGTEFINESSEKSCACIHYCSN